MELNVVKPGAGNGMGDRKTFLIGETSMRSNLATGFVVMAAALSAAPAIADSGHSHAAFSAGEPGNPKRPARVVQVAMEEGDGKMLFVPDRVEVKRGEQVRFVLRNDGELDHEFVLATAEENIKHADQMMENHEMAHTDPNARRLAPKKSDEMVWRFTKAGTFEFGCLIPGHREAGMIGTIVVK